MTKLIDLISTQTKAIPALTAIVSLCLYVGCSNRPSQIYPPSYDPEEAGHLAIELYDKDADGMLSPDELKQCPGIHRDMKKYDRDRDGQVTADEVAARVQSWADSLVGIQGISFRVLMDGRPLAGGMVELEPEPFLDGIVPKATGKISKAGNTSPSAAPEDLPDGIRGGMRCGVYKLRITHPEVDVPARYNIETELGLDVGHDVDIYNAPIFKIRSKK